MHQWSLSTLSSHTLAHTLVPYSDSGIQKHFPTGKVKTPIRGHFVAILCLLWGLCVKKASLVIERICFYTTPLSPTHQTPTHTGLDRRSVYLCVFKFRTFVFSILLEHLEVIIGQWRHGFVPLFNHSEVSLNVCVQVCAFIHMCWNAHIYGLMLRFHVYWHRCMLQCSPTLWWYQIRKSGETRAVLMKEKWRSQERWKFYLFHMESKNGMRIHGWAFSLTYSDSKI